MANSPRPYALLSVGELLADLIGHHVSSSLLDAQDFRRYQGGSPANMATNMARLGGQVALVSCVGDDNIGKYLVRQIEESGVDTQFITADPLEPTTIVLVSRTAGTPDFVAYRHADCQLKPEQLPDSLLAQTQLFHTTCFALSQQPAQDTIIDAARRAKAAGCQVTIDANYAPSIWPDRDQAWRVLTDYFTAGALVKVSEDDAERLYGSPQTPERILSDFHKMGATTICLTLGANGSLVSYDGGTKQARIPGKKIDVVDVTGAGDAYWAGFLTAYLDGYAPGNCAHAGAALAKMKLTRQGPLPDKVDRKLIYADFE
ncbi:carbohydrate kinase [Spirosoma sp. KCTC 42546]|uniref:carbohydrate kinase family protein n=1 Tax=Spirosoma sp. KCTC 42546 TaxID=2520506 RepID=UPI001158FE49|nr:carbohydrate kinase [Spirosoma sp. KCTC 42546]QDK79487.1 carbohydrate kinase [Spirosoma sp. KCTC 42546]